MSLINQPMTLLGNDASEYVTFDDLTYENAYDMDEIVDHIYALVGDPYTRNLIPGIARTCTFVQAGKNSAENSDPSSTGDLDLTISAYSTSYSGFPTDIIALEFTGIDNTILDSIASISLSAEAHAPHAELTIAAYIGPSMPSTNDNRWKNIVFNNEISTDGVVNASSSLLCDYRSNGKIYLKIVNHSIVNMWDTSSMNFILTSLSITTEDRIDNHNFQIY